MSTLQDSSRRLLEQGIQYARESAQARLLGVTLYPPGSEDQRQIEQEAADIQEWIAAARKVLNDGR